MIIPEHKILFIHIPKTGGTSIEKFFCQHFNLLEGGVDFCDFLKDGAHHCLKYYKNWEQCFTFSFVRNPYERIISHYAYTKRYTSWNCYSSINHLFKQIIKVGSNPGFNKNFNTLPQSTNIHLIPQYQFFNGVKINFIGKYETYRQDFKKVLRLLKIKYQPINQHVYKTTQNDKKILRNELKKPQYKNIIDTIYDKDFQLFNYKKEL